MPPGKQHMDDTHGVPGSFWELPQLQALAAVLRESPRATCAQQPANPICPPDKQFHILSRKDFRTTAKTHSLHCFCLVLSPQGHMGWLEMRTYHRANTSTWDFLMDVPPVQDTEGKAGQEAPREPVLLFHMRGWSQCHQLTLRIDPTPHQVLQPAQAVFSVAPSAFWGESLIFQGKLDTQGLTLITGSGHWSMKTGAETTSLLLLQEFCYGKPESVCVPSQDTRPSVSKQEGSSTKKQTFTCECCSELYSEGNSAGSVTNKPSSWPSSVFAFTSYIHFIKQIRALLLKWPV